MMAGKGVPRHACRRAVDRQHLHGHVGVAERGCRSARSHAGELWNLQHFWRRAHDERTRYGRVHRRQRQTGQLSQLYKVIREDEIIDIDPTASVVLRTVTAIRFTSNSGGEDAWACLSTM